jgi:hypothetical protein
MKRLLTSGGLVIAAFAAVLVLVRHPAAFVASYLRIDEPNRLPDLLSQPALMADLLAPLAGDVRRYAAGARDRVGEAVTLWRAVNQAVDVLAPGRGWLIRRHEGLATDPHGGFADVFDAFGLAFTAAVRRRIAETTDGSNPAEAPDGVLHQLRRDSRAATTAWRRRLSPEQVRRIREEVGELGHRHYPDDAWW